MPLLRVVTFRLGIVQLVWIARYAYEDFGGIIGVVVAWLVFPLTLIVSPIYGVLAHGDWLGVLLVAIGPVTCLLLGLLVASRIGDGSDDGLPDTATTRDRSSSLRPPVGGVAAQSVSSPPSPPTAAQMPARAPYRDPIDLRIDELAISHAHTAERLRGVHEQARQFFLNTNVWLAADAIWTIVQTAWPVALLRGQLERATRLLAAAERIREVGAAPMLPNERIESTATVRTVRHKLASAVVEVAWGEGRRENRDSQSTCTAGRE